MMSEPMLAGAERYHPSLGCYDEVYAPGGTPRPHATPLAFELARLGADHLAAAGRRRDAAFVEQGITFESDEDGQTETIGRELDGEWHEAE